MALDSDNKPVFDLHLVVVDDRLTDDDVERWVKRVDCILQLCSDCAGSFACRMS